MEKHHISATELLRDAYSLALEIMRSGFQPDLIVGIWRGGSPVGIAIHEVFDYCGRPCDHCAIRTSSYIGVGKQRQVSIQGLDQVTGRVLEGSRLLLVDDVFDTGNTMAAIVNALERAMPDAGLDIRIATPWYKPRMNVTQRVPDYYRHTTDRWLVFPHELEGLEDEEVLQKPDLAELAEQLITMRNTQAKLDKEPVS